MTPCMGGWCPCRDECPSYGAFSRKKRPVERLCGPVPVPDPRQRNATFYRHAQIAERKAA